ncbi:hypothetical protein B0H13DRAFT_1908037 [Mycena leptocephala]|nr:hypothetical protein B0H13DRAFT_1908037 [Mycena leptocephala]
MSDPEKDMSCDKPKNAYNEDLRGTKTNLHAVMGLRVDSPACRAPNTEYWNAPDGMKGLLDDSGRFLVKFTSKLEVFRCVSAHQCVTNPNNQPFGPETPTSAMEGESTTDILKNALEPTPAYNTDVGASASIAEMEKGEKSDAQPHVDPFDPSPLIVLIAAEPDCVVCANADSLNEHKQNDSECLNWATQLPGILFKINSGLEYLMPDCAQGVRKKFAEDSNNEHEV